MGEGEGFVCAAAEFYEVEFVGFKGCAEVFAFLGVEAFILKFDAVNFDAKDEGCGEAFADALSDLHD